MFEGRPSVWTIHVCEDHGRLDCALCGVFDVVHAVPQEAALALARWTQHLPACARSKTTADDCTCGLQEAWAVLS